jgi:hypothetical protein
MDLSILPEAVVRYMSTFLYIVSWRAEHHFHKMLNYYQTLTFDNIPSYMKSSIKEYPEYYLYQHASRYVARTYKTNLKGIVMMKFTYLNMYLDPLREYLLEYRKNIIQNAWTQGITFTLLGIHVDGNLPPDLYKHYIMLQGVVEGNKMSSLWNGCLTKEYYKHVACTLRITPIEMIHLNKYIMELDPLVNLPINVPDS